MQHGRSVKAVGMNMGKCQEWGQFTSTISNNLHDAIVGTAGIECLHFSMQFVSLV